MVGSKGQNFQSTMIVFVQFTVLMCFDSILNLLERVTASSFLFLCKVLVFLFLPFLNLGAQIRCPQNWYTNLRLALDQPMTYQYIYVLIF